MAELLTDAEVAAALTALPQWRRDGTTLVRTVELPTFPEAIALVDRVARAAEERDHHPDMDVRWRTLTFVCSTHSAGGITARDVDLAEEIDRLASP